MKGKLPGKVIFAREASFVTKFKWKNDSNIVLKVKFGKDPVLKDPIDREQVSLDVLKGLAVPKKIFIPREKVAKLLKDQRFYHVAMEYIPFKGCFGRQFSTEDSLGIWAFAIEQLCAFRRRQILYTDMKHNHICLSEDLSEARILDFDACILLEPRGVYPAMVLGSTPELAAPEFYFASEHTECVIVYQVAMLLGSFMLKFFHNSEVNLKSFKKIKRLLSKACCLDVYKLFIKCLSEKPQNRPKNLEVLFKELERIELPEGSYQRWIQLRSPYQKELLKLGFNDPSISVYERKVA